MPNNYLNCVIPEWKKEQPDFEQVDPTMPSNISKHLRKLHDDWKVLNSKVAGNPGTADNVRVFFDRLDRIGNIAGATTYDPNFFNRMQSRVTYGLLDRIKRGAQNLTGGNVHEYVTRLDRQARGYIVRQLADAELANKAKSLNTKLKAVWKKHKVTNTNKAYMALKLNSISAQPHLIQYSTGANPAAQRYLIKDRMNFIKWMEDAGLDGNEIKQLFDLSDEMVQTEFEIALIAKKAGVDPSGLMGGLDKLLTPQAKRMLEKLDDAPDFLSLNSKPSEWFKQSRLHNILIPSDINTLDYLLDNAGVFKRINNNPDLQQLFGKQKITSIRDVLLSGNDPIINQAFINELSSSEFDFLVETGLMAKIPIDTPTLFENYIKHYQLPFEGLNEMFIYNPEEAVKAYGKHLEDLSASEGKLWGLVKGATDKFGIPKSVVETSGDEYKRFVPLSDVLPKKLTKRIGDVSLKQQLGELYVHPEIAKYYKGMLEVTTNPVTMGILGDTMHTTRRLTQAMMLGTPQWLARAIVGNAGLLGANGVGVHNYARHFTGMVAAQAKSLGTGEVVDYAKHLSKESRKIYKRGLAKGVLGDWNVLGKAGEGVELTGRGVQDSLKELMWIKKHHPDLLPQEAFKAGKHGLEAAANSTLYKYLSFGNAMTDNAGKLAFAEHLVNKGMGIDDAWDYVYDHWYKFDTLPRKNLAYDTAASMVPFLGFMYSNTQLAVRMLAENPAKFGSFLKLVHMHKQEFKDEYEMENYLKETPWRKNYHQTYPYVIPADMSGTGKDELFEYQLSVLFSPFSVFDDAGDILDFMGVFNSDKPPSERLDNPFRSKESKTRQIISEGRVVFDNPISAVLEMVARYEEELIKADKGNYSKRQLFGVEVSNAAYVAVTGSLPSIRTFDKVFGYTGLGGEAPDLNEKTGEYNPGKPSWTGAYPARPLRSQQPSGVKGQAIMDALGMAPNYIDIYEQMYRKIGEIDSIRRQARSEINSYNHKVANIKEVDPTKRTEEHKRLLRQYQKHLAWAYMVDLQWNIIQTWRKDQGLPSKEAIEKIRAANLTIDRLLPEGEIQSIANQLYKKYNNDFINAYEEPWLQQK